MIERRFSHWAKSLACVSCICGLILLITDGASPYISNVPLSWLAARPYGKTKTTLGVSHTYILTASQVRLAEMSTMLDYAGIDFTAIWGPSVWSKSFNETFLHVFPDKGDFDDTILKRREIGSEAQAEGVNEPPSRHLSKRMYRLRFRYALACLIGHRSIWQEVLRQKHERVLVMEDDLDLNYSIGPVMDEVWRQVPDDWDIIMLGHDAGEYWTDETPERGQITRRMRSTWGTFAYILNARIIPIILQSTADNMRNPVDLTITWNMPRAGELKMYAVEPQQAQQIPVDSIIQDRLSEVVSSFAYNGLAFASGAWNGITVK